MRFHQTRVLSLVLAVSLSVVPPSSTHASLPALIQRYSDGKQQLSRSFAEALNESIQRSLRATHERTREQSQVSGCKARLQTGFLDGTEPLFQELTDRPLNRVEKAFAEGILRIDAVSCLEKGEPSQVAKIYLSPEYRLSAIPSAVSSRREGNSRICDAASGFPLLLKASNFCSDIRESRIESGFTIDTELGWNDPQALEIYLFDTKMSTYTAGNHTVFHFSSFARGPNVTSILRSFVLQNMRSSHQRAVGSMLKLLP